MLIGVLAALAAGAAFAVAGVLQQRVAGGLQANDSLSLRLLADLARRPMWLAGIGAAFISYGLQSLALAFAPLTVVQPLIVAELLFAIPASARLRRVQLTVSEWAGVAAVAGGLAVGLWAESPTPGVLAASAGRWGVAFAVVFAAVGLAVVVGLRHQGALRASAYAAAAAITLGTQSGLLAQTVHLIAARGLLATLGSWEPYAMTAASLVGLLLVQNAFHAGPLASTLPITDTVEPLTASLLGVVVLGETIDTTAVHLVLLAVGGVLLAAGVIALDSSPVIRALRDAQSAEQLAATHGNVITTAVAACCRAGRRCHGIPGSVEISLVCDLAADETARSAPR